MQSQAASAVIAKAKQKRSGALANTQGTRGEPVRGGQASRPAGRDGGNAMSGGGISQPMMAQGGPMPPGGRGGSSAPNVGPLPPGADIGRIGGPVPGGLPPVADVGRMGQGGDPNVKPMPTAPPGGPNLMSLLPPAMQRNMATNGRDPREAIQTRMQNDPIFKQKMIEMQQSGGFRNMPGPGGPPSGPISAPMQPPGGPQVDPSRDMQASSANLGPPTELPGLPGGLPPGADIGRMGGQMQPGDMQRGFPTPGQGGQGFNQQQLKQMLPPAMQQGFQGNSQGMNLQAIQQQMQGGGPAPQMGGFGGAGQGGGNPFRYM